MNKIIEKIKEKSKKIKDKIKERQEEFDRKVQDLLESYRRLSVSMKAITIIGSIISLEFMIVAPSEIYKAYEATLINEPLIQYENVVAGKENNYTLNEFLKSNMNFISKATIEKVDETYQKINFEMNSAYTKFMEEKSLFFGEKNVVDSNLYIISSDIDNNVELPIIYIITFEHINVFSFTNFYEKILIENNIRYTWLIKDEIVSPYRITNLILSHVLQIAFILVFLFLFEKQGLFGNKEKYSIVYPNKIQTNFKDLIGMEEIKNEIYILADLIEHRDKYKEFGIDKAFNYIFSGPPGTGKTQIAGGLAKLLDVPMVIGTGNVETGFINGGVSVIQELFKTARLEALQNPHKMAIIFLDEAQTLLVQRGQQREKWADDSANELLAQLDGIHTYSDVDIIFIAASNFDDKNHKFDEAMMRRFKKKLFFRLPNLEERKGILEFYASKINEKYKSDNIDFNYLADITANMSPALLESMVQEASLLSITTKKDLVTYEEKANSGVVKKLDLKKIKEIVLDKDKVLKDKDELFEKEITLIDTKLLERAFERISIGHTDRKTTANKERQRDIISKHELGHFVCEMQNVLNDKFGVYHVNAETDYKFLKTLNKEELSDAIIHLKNNLQVLKISVESISQINALGYVLNKQEDVMLSSKNDLEKEIIALYGGLASEDIFSANNGDITTGSANDIEKVSNLFNIMVNKLGMYSKSKLNFNFIDNMDNKEENSEVILTNSEKLFNISKCYVENHRDLILALNNELLEKYVLNLDEILSFIENYYNKTNN